MPTSRAGLAAPVDRSATRRVISSLRRFDDQLAGAAGTGQAKNKFC
jgi:hypothetical protein